MREILEQHPFDWPEWFRPRKRVRPLTAKKTRRVAKIGVSAFDEALGGGFPGHGICELSGFAGTGKTQMCLALAAEACRSGTVYYVYTEGPFPIERLSQMEDDSGRLENIIVESVTSIPMLYHVIGSKLPKLAEALEDAEDERDPLTLVIIDSIAAWFRGEEDFKFRANTLFKISSLLKRLAEDYNFSVVVTNHVVAGENHLLSPALGEAAACCWAHAFSLWRTDRHYEKPPDSAGYGPILYPIQHAPFHRIIRVDRSLVVPRLMIEFSIETDGIKCG